MVPDGKRRLTKAVQEMEEVLVLFILLIFLLLRFYNHCRPEIQRTIDRVVFHLLFSSINFAHFQ